MKPIKAYLSAGIIAALLSCSKEETVIVPKDNEMSAACLDKFFTYQRRIIFEESFIDNSNNWEIGRTTPIGPCVPWALIGGSKWQIENGLLLKGGCSPTDTAFAYFFLPRDTVMYLAAEVKFKDFWMISAVPNQIQSGGCFFEFGSNNFALSIPGSMDPGFSMNLAGHVVHFLLDQKGSQSRAFSDEFINHNSAPGSQYEPIINENLSKLIWMRKLDEKEDFITFLSYATVSDVGFDTWTTHIEYITIYEPIFPCN